MHAHRHGEALDDRQQRIGRQHRRLVRVRVVDLLLRREGGATQRAGGGDAGAESVSQHFVGV